MTSLLPRNRRTTAPRIRLPRTAFSLAAAALVATVPAFAQQPYGAGARTRPVSTFNTPYPTTPTPGPVQPYVEQQVATARPNVPAQQPSAPRPGGATAPGAADKVMYFHKQENSLVPDGMADSSEVAMAVNSDVPAVATGVPDVPESRPGTLPPAAVVERPLAEPAFELVIR